MHRCHTCCCLLRSRCLASPHSAIYSPLEREPVARRHQITVAKGTTLITVLRLQLVGFKNIILRYLIRKANWNSVVSPIDPNKRYIAISNKWRYIEKEKRIIFRRGLLDWLLPIWTLPSAWNMWRNTGW